MTKKIADLAIFGGAPAFTEPLHVGRPNIGDRRRLLERINDLLDRRWLTNNGPLVQEFEQRLAAFTGVRHCIPMCNGTVALEIAIRASELRGEVIVPSLTFVATAHALQWQEITPVFCDVDPRTYTLDPNMVDKMVTPRTTGIIGVHLFGRSCDIESIGQIAKKRNLKLLFDAAHAFGCSYKGRLIGGFGNAEIFSFHATKFLNSFEGGAIATNDDDLAARIRLMKNFGFAGYDNVIHIGTNGKMTEVCAAMGLTSLESLDEFIDVNRRNYQDYRLALDGMPGIHFMRYEETERCNYQYVILEVDEQITGVSRDQMVHILHAENILARRYFYPGGHNMEPYRSYFPHAGLMLPETERIAKRLMALPTGTAVGPGEIAIVCDILQLIVKQGSDIRQRLPS